MDAATLASAMGCPRDRADRYVADMNAAMLQAGCTTVNRAAMWCAQIGHESLGLRYMEEIADGSAYENRKDLGNTQPGDGRRFKGRGPIQLTGRLGYGEFLRWCRDRGLNPPDFLADPAQVATPRWGFLAAAHYWTVRRSRLNEASDAGNLLLASQMVNGYVKKPNGLEDRQERWDRCRGIGPALLPGGGVAPPIAAGPDALPELRHGMRGDPRVASLQRFLNAYGWRPALPLLPVTGNYLDQTADVLRRAQAQMGVQGGDGRNTGPQTRRALWGRGWRG